MQTQMASNQTETIPKKRVQHQSHDESADQPAKLLEKEAVEIEKEIPVDDRESIERTEPEDASDPSVFEE